MYDTINLWLPFESTGVTNFSKTIESLTQVTDHTRRDNETSTSGHLENYKVNLSGQGVSLKGSLAKYSLPDNFHTLTRSTTQTAIEKLSDELHLDIGRAKITRLDFAQNIIMKEKPEMYYNYLGSSTYYNRHTNKNSVYYSNNLKQKIFYNKPLEGLAKKVPLPNVWENRNILRYEMRYLSRLPQAFKLNEIIAKNLFDESFYMLIFDKWEEEYLKIKKIPNMHLNIKEIETPKDCDNYLMRYAIEHIGYNNLMQDLSNLKQGDRIKHPKYIERMKDKINSLCKAPKVNDEMELIEELDKKIKRAKEYYR